MALEVQCESGLTYWCSFRRILRFVFNGVSCLGRQNWLKKNCGMKYGIFRARKVPSDKGSSQGGENGKCLII